MSSAHPAVLTIAGSDPSGGAGIQADLKTFTTFKCFGTSVLTALTAQNTTGVHAVHAPPPEFVAEQLRLVLEDAPICALKTGMLYNASTIEAVVKTLLTYYQSTSSTFFPAVVCDPVCVSTSGYPLLQDDALETLISNFFPLANLITPNKLEAEALLRSQGLPSEINTVEDMLVRARALTGLGPRAVLLKGGHLVVSETDIQKLLCSRNNINVVRGGGLLSDNMEILAVGRRIDEPNELVVDVLCQEGGIDTIFLRPRIDSTSTHGTGCTLSAAITAGLAKGQPLVETIRNATEYTHLGITEAFTVGKGFGPLNHMHGIRSQLLPRPTPSNPYPLTRYILDSIAPTWKLYVEHDFVKQLGKGTLSKQSFIHFIRQDYLYLRYYARASGLLAAKAHTFPAMGSAAQTIANIVAEIDTHGTFCEKWGLSKQELQNTPESLTTTAYGAFLLDVGIQGDYVKLVMALAACLLGYGEVGLWLARESKRPETWVMTESNPYQRWMDDYSGDTYQSAVRAGLDLIEACAAADPPTDARLAEWRDVWERCTRFEIAFWDMGLNLS